LPIDAQVQNSQPIARKSAIANQISGLWGLNRKILHKNRDFALPQRVQERRAVDSALNVDEASPD